MSIFPLDARPAIQGDVLTRLVISIQHRSYPRYPVCLSAFLPLFPHEMELQRTLAALSLHLRAFDVLSFSLQRLLCLRATLIRSPEALALPTLTLFSYGFSPPPTRIDPLFSTSQLFLICCSHPRSGRRSYQPGRTRVHILQAFMMAAAHLCKPVCLACLRQARPLSTRQRLPMLRGQPNFRSPFSFSGFFFFFFFLVLLDFYFLFISRIHSTRCPFSVAMLRVALHPRSLFIRACCLFPRVFRLFEPYFSTVLNRSCS